VTTLSCIIAGGSLISGLAFYFGVRIGREFERVQVRRWIRYRKGIDKVILDATQPNISNN
jgi:hypothetical protein